MRRAELEALTRDKIMEIARKLEIRGRSALSKDGLIEALMKVQARTRKPLFISRKRPGTAQAGKAAGQAGRRTAGVKPARQTAKSIARVKKPARRTSKAPAGTRQVTGRVKETPSQAQQNIARARKKLPQAKREGVRGVKAVAQTSKATARKKKDLAMPNKSRTQARKVPRPAGKATRPAGKATQPAGNVTRPARKAVAQVDKAASGAKRDPAAIKKARTTAKPGRLKKGKAGPSPAVRPTRPERQAGRRGAAAAQGLVGAELRMPERYGKNYMGLMVRDPYWLHAYWEVTTKAIDGLQRRLGAQWEGHRWVLRVSAYPPDAVPTTACEGNGEDRYDIELPPETSNWYINVGRPGRVYSVAVGVIDRRGKFHALARSNVVSTPRDDISPVMDEEWTTAPETFRRLYDMASPASHAPGRSSAEVGMLLRERLRTDWASGMLASMSSGELARQQPPERAFWFVLDAELLVYGATEPDATVTIQGRPIKLRSDGTFSLRFQLPDGTQVIDATAVSADGVFHKTITPTVRRETRAHETIENGQYGSIKPGSRATSKTGPETRTES